MQARVQALWVQVSSENVYQLTDFAGYKQEFLRLFGFDIDGVDYEADVDPSVEIRGLV
ncbi:Enoyl-[acyl-carrier-protein] reductase [NADH] [compost metagenome]